MEVLFLISLGGKTTIHCTGSWWLLVSVILLCVSIMFAYITIANDWRKRRNECKSVEGKRALRDISNIFMWCAVCGYGFRILLSFYPAWGVYLLFLGWLNFISWRYVYRSKDLKIVYQKLSIADGILNGMYAHITNPAEKLTAIQNDLKAIRGS